LHPQKLLFHSHPKGRKISKLLTTALISLQGELYLYHPLSCIIISAIIISNGYDRHVCEDVFLHTGSLPQHEYMPRSLKKRIHYYIPISQTVIVGRCLCYSTTHIVFSLCGLARLSYEL